MGALKGPLPPSLPPSPPSAKLQHPRKPSPVRPNSTPGTSPGNDHISGAPPPAGSPGGMGRWKHPPPPPLTSMSDSYRDGTPWDMPPDPDHVADPSPLMPPPRPYYQPGVPYGNDTSSNLAQGQGSKSAPPAYGSGNVNLSVIVFAFLGVVGVVVFSVAILICIAIKTRALGGNRRRDREASTENSSGPQELPRIPVVLYLPAAPQGLDPARVKCLPTCVFSADAETMRAGMLEAAEGVRKGALTSSFWHRPRGEEPTLDRTESLTGMELLDKEGMLAECPVCLGDYKEGDVLKWLPGCHHAFHGECIDAWLLAKNSCPLCRVQVGVTEGKSPLEGTIDV